MRWISPPASSKRAATARGSSSKPCVQRVVLVVGVVLGDGERERRRGVGHVGVVAAGVVHVLVRLAAQHAVQQVPEADLVERGAVEHRHGPPVLGAQLVVEGEQAVHDVRLQLVGVHPLLVGVQQVRHLGGVGEVLDPELPAPQVHQVVGAPVGAHGELARGEVQVVDEPHHDLVRLEPAHPAQLGLDVRHPRHGVAVQPPADAVAVLEERDLEVGAVLLEAPRRVHAGDAAADHGDVVAALGGLGRLVGLVVQDSLGHACLFCGGSGVGRREVGIGDDRGSGFRCKFFWELLRSGFGRAPAGAGSGCGSVGNDTTVPNGVEPRKLRGSRRFALASLTRAPARRVSRPPHPPAPSPPQAGERGRTAVGAGRVGAVGGKAAGRVRG